VSVHYSAKRQHRVHGAADGVFPNGGARRLLPVSAHQSDAVVE